MNDKPEIEVGKLPVITKFIYTLGVLPTSYLMSMTYQEQVTWLYNYLQTQVIPAINTDVEAVQELQTLYELLRTYVNDYFDNLDVQEEINNKLDEMAESGQLTDIIAQYLGLAGMITFNNVDEMKQAENLVNGSKCCTLGYHEVNDGGKAVYKVRTITNEDVIDEGSIIALNENTLIAELVSNEVNPVMFGAYGDGITNDYNAFKNCFDYANNNKLNIILPKKTYVIIGNRLTLKTNLNGNDAIIISNDNENGINLDEPLIHVISDNEFTAIPSGNDYIFRTYPGHSNIWKRSGNTAESALGITPVEANVQIKNTLLYDYFFNFSNPTTEYRKLDEDISIKNLVINKTIVNSTRTTYIKRNILIERDNVLLENVVFNLTDNTTNTAPYLGLIKLNKCYNVRLNNCVIPAQLTNSSYAFHTSYDVKTIVENCYMNGEYDCWGATSSNGSVDMTYSKCNTNRIDAHEGFFGITIKDCELGKEGITLTGGKYCNVISCHFNGRRCIALREDYGSGFNGIIRLKDCDGSVTQGEIIYLKSNTDFDYGYEWKAPCVEIEDCNINTTAGRLDIFAYTIDSNSDLSWYSNTNTIKVTNFTTNKNIRLFNCLPHLFGDCDILLENLNLRGGFYTTYVNSSTNYTIFVNVNKCVIRYPKTNTMVRINGFYTNCEFLDLEFVHLNTTLCGCSLREKDSITCGYTDSGKHMSMVNMGLLIKNSEILTWHENCYNYKAE